MDGFINIDKPAGMTSAQVVGRLKRLLFPLCGRFKIGHTGTLDPAATGVLPIACGEATKAVPYMEEARKTYVFSVRFGTSTTTDDADGETMGTSDAIPSQSEIDSVLPGFKGRISQVPPAYSAVKVAGRRAYDLARVGARPELKPRPNFVHELKLLGQISQIEFEFEVSAGKGFYVRSLARDMALALGSLGHVGSLRRTRSGTFAIGSAITLDKLEEILHNAAQSSDVRNCIGLSWLDISAALDGIPALEIDESRNIRLRNGNAVPCTAPAASVLEILCGGKLSAIGKCEMGLLRPIRVFNL